MSKDFSRELSSEELGNITGGNFGAMRNAIKVIKSDNPKSFDLGGAAYDLQHSGSSMKAPRRWLGGRSIDQRIDTLIPGW